MIISRDPNALRIVEGAWDLEDSSNSVFKIQRTIMHDYNPYVQAFENNSALLKKAGLYIALANKATWP